MSTSPSSGGAATAEAPEEVVPVHLASGAPAPQFASCDAPASAARADPVNALALAAPRLLANPAPRALRGDSTVEDFPAFEARFKKLTGDAFAAFTADDWANMVVAGGAVVLALTPDAAPSPNCDVDVFFHGLDADAARHKIERLFATLKAAAPSALALRTPHTLTVVLPAPKRIVQVVLNLHAAPADVVGAFDVDACGCYYDGRGVFATRRCARAFATRVNLAVASRRSYTYESRLVKYAKRGFEIGVPGLRVADVQLKKPVDVYTYARDLPKDDPRYQEGGYKRVATGKKYVFGDDYGWRYNDDGSKPDMHSYMEAEGVRKLLLADLSGREVFQREGRRTKYVPHSRDTMAIAEYLMQSSDPYGPATPDVPGAEKYAVAPAVAKFTRCNPNHRSYCAFVQGAIKTGAAAGFDEDKFFDDCYIPMDE